MRGFPMAIVAPQERKHLSAAALLRVVRSGCVNLPDSRPGDPDIACTETLMAAFAMFALPSPSLLACDEARSEGNVHHALGDRARPVRQAQARDPCSGCPRVAPPSVQACLSATPARQGT